MTTQAVYREHDFRPGLPDQRPPQEPVPVHVEDVYPGVWARVTGTTPDGDPITVTGAVVAGPHLLGAVVAVAVRDYRARRDVAVLVPARGSHDPAEPIMVRLRRLAAERAGEADPSGRGLVYLVDDPDDYAGHAEDALAPVFADCDAERVELARWPGDAPGRDRRNLRHWTPETFTDVAAADLAALEAHPDVLITAVHWADLPIGDTR